MRTKFASLVLAALLGLGAGAGQAAEGKAMPDYDWSFSGIFGHFDRAALRRGLQVYAEVCAGCHSLKRIAFRNLAALGFDEARIKGIAAQYTIEDGPNDEGEMFERPGRPSDRFPAPFPNAKAAAAANGGAIPPDLSLMAKARKGGPNHIRALLTGYKELPPKFRELPEFGYLPQDFELIEELNFNEYFPGYQIAMAPPLSEDVVEFADGTRASEDQMAADVATFLMWTAEPNLEERRRMGFKVILFLLAFTAVLYAAKRKIWSDLH